MGFAIPISDVKDLINQLMNGENDLSGGTIGVEGFMTTDYENTSNLPKGFYIQNITKGSGADKAGLEIGNIITEIDGKNVEEFSVISDYLDEKNKGEEIELTIAYPSGREYKEKSVTVKLS